MNSIAERLISARKMKGLSLQELSDALNNRVSRQALHKYEKGQTVPDSSLINAIAYVLDVRPDYFYREKLVAIEQPSYRKLKKLSVTEQNKALESSRDLLERYLELEALWGIESAFVNPLSEEARKVSDAQGVEKAAALVRQKWDLGSDTIPNVMELLENREIKVLEIEAHEAFNGMSAMVSGNIPIVVVNVNKTHSVDRRRFTALHELAHLILEFPEGIEEKIEERLCHAFAGAMLLPEDKLKYELGVKRHELYLKELVQVKEKYGISIQATIMRAKTHGIISDYYTEQFFEKFRAMGYARNEPGNYCGTEKATRFNQLLLRGVAEEAFSIGKAAALAGMTVAAFREFLKVDKPNNTNYEIPTDYADSDH